MELRIHFSLCLISIRRTRSTLISGDHRFVPPLGPTARWTMGEGCKGVGGVGGGCRRGGGDIMIR